MLTNRLTKFSFFLFFPMIFLSIAVGQKKETGKFSPIKIPFEVLLEKSQGGAEKDTQFVFEDASSYDTYFKTDQPKTKIDFNKEGVIVLTSSNKPTSGYIIKVLSVTRESTGMMGGSLTVGFTIMTPPKGKKVTQVLSSPVTAIKTLKPFGMPVFKKK